MLGQSSPDIRQKLQRSKESDNRNLEALMGEDWRVYNNRDKQEKKNLVGAIVAAFEQHQREGCGRGRGRGKGGNRGSSNPSQGRLRLNQCAYCKEEGHWKCQGPELLNSTQETVVATIDNSECWGLADLSLADPLVKIQLGNDKEVEFLIDTIATFSLLNQALMPKSEKHIQVMAATGQPENAFFLKPLEYKIGKRMGIHQFLYLPNTPKSLLDRDILENLEATIEFRKGKMKFEVPEGKLILALGLEIDTGPANNSNYLEQIMNQVYLGVWNTNAPGRSKLADCFKIELQAGTKPVVRRQYPLRIEDRKGIK